MPTTDEILDGLQTIANNWQFLAILWHIYFGALIVALVLGVRPGLRTAGLALSPPLVSVSILAWLTGNPFNGLLFALSSAGLVVLSLRLAPRPVWIAHRAPALAGLFLVMFGWFYPHFLPTSSMIPYLYAAPTGLIPCPTLSIVIGAGLVLDGLGSRTWGLLAGVVGLFYGLFGAVRLGVTIDWILVAGSSIMLACAIFRNVGYSRTRIALVGTRNEGVNYDE